MSNSTRLIWQIGLLLLALQASYITSIVVMADLAWLADRPTTVGGVDWGAFSVRFPIWERLLGHAEVLAYWIAFVLMWMRRRIFLPFYVFAAAVRVYFWMAFASVPEVPTLPGYIATLNEVAIVTIIYAGFRWRIYR